MNTRRIPAWFCTLLLLLAPAWLPAQNANLIGHWTSYLSQKKIVEITRRGQEVYAISEGGMFRVNISTQEIETYTTIDGLSSVKPSCIYTDPASNLVFLGFPDGSLNYFQDPADISTITDISRNLNFTVKSIRSITSHNGLLYLATEFGLVIFDIDKKETRGSVIKVGVNDNGLPINTLAIYRDTCWVAMEGKGLFYAPLNVPNISNPTVWLKASGIQGLPDKSCRFVTQTDANLYAIVGDTLYRRSGSTWDKVNTPPASFTYMRGFKDYLVFCYGAHTSLLRDDQSLSDYYNYSIVNCGYYDGDGPVWVGDRILGLQRFENGSVTNLSPNGPKNNFVTQIVAGNGEMYICPTGKNGSSNRYFDRSGIPYYSASREGWKLLDLLNGGLSPSVGTDFARGAYHAGTGRTFIGSWGDGIMELLHGDTVRSYTPANSGITNEATVTGLTWCRVSGLYAEENQNLWATIMLAQRNLNLMAPDGQWYNWELPHTFPIGILVDPYGSKWVNNQGNGFTVFNENGTFTDASDDKIKYFDAQSSNGLISSNVFDMALDLDGQIWVGTDQGISVIYDPGSVFSSSFSGASEPIIDGFPLLRDQKVSAIAVDGANRKWCGTEDGVYVISEDGTQQLGHFTEANSPLPDDKIIDIAIDGKTGEVFIGTNKGLISYMAEAIDGQETSDSLYAYPNPVQVDYEGPVAISGSVGEAEVKITTVDGLLVRHLYSQGGRTLWDLRDTWGNLVKPGIYLALVSDAEGKGAGVTKIAVLESISPR